MPNPVKLGRLLAKLARPQNALYPALLASGSALLTHANTIAVVACFVFFICMYAVAATYNNMQDVETDRLNHRVDNPLITYKLSQRTLELFALITIVVTLGLQLFMNQPVSFSIFLAYTVLLVAYSHPRIRIQARGWLAPLLLSVCYGGLPLLLGLSQNISLHNQTVWQLVLAQVVLTLPIILAKDYKDMKGDKATKKHTPLVLYGARLVQTVAIALSLTGAAYFAYLVSKLHLDSSVIVIVCVLYITSVIYLHARLGRLAPLLRKAYTPLAIAMPLLLVWRFARNIFC